jgi:hypothetical protein
MTYFEVSADANIGVAPLDISQQGECGIADYAFGAACQIRTHGKNSVKMHYAPPFF